MTFCEYWRQFPVYTMTTSAVRLAVQRAEATRTRLQRSREQRVTRTLMRRTLKRTAELEERTEELREQQLAFYQQTLRLQEAYMRELQHLGSLQSWARSVHEQRLLMADQFDNLVRLSEVAVNEARSTPAAASTVQTRELAKRMMVLYHESRATDGQLKQLLQPPVGLSEDDQFPTHVAEENLDQLESYQPQNPFEYDHTAQSQLPVPRTLLSLRSGAGAIPK